MKKEQEIIDKNQAIETIKPIFEKYNSFSKDHDRSNTFSPVFNNCNNDFIKRLKE